MGVATHQMWAWSHSIHAQSIFFTSIEILNSDNSVQIVLIMSELWNMMYTAYYNVFRLSNHGHFVSDSLKFIFTECCGDLLLLWLVNHCEVKGQL